MTTTRDDIAGLSERLRAALGRIAQEESGGDNLAILLASYFEPGIEDEELDESCTWKQGAIDACDKVLDAIHAHYATALDALHAERQALRVILSNCAAAIGNGAAMLPECSLEFMSKLPEEIAAHTEKLRRFLKCSRDEGTEALDRAAAAECRATRAEQQRDEAYDRLKPFASGADALLPSLPDEFEVIVRIDATPLFSLKAGEVRAARDLVRRLAAGTEKEKNNA